MFYAVQQIVYDFILLTSDLFNPLKFQKNIIFCAYKNLGKLTKSELLFA